MPGPDLYTKYRRLIEDLADESRSTQLSRAALRDLLKQFETEAGALKSAPANSVCDEIAGQLEQEALRCINKHRRDVLLTAVKGFDDMSFPIAKS
jgi:hypothetical protein